MQLIFFSYDDPRLTNTEKKERNRLQAFLTLYMRKKKKKKEESRGIEAHVGAFPGAAVRLSGHLLPEGSPKAHHIHGKLGATSGGGHDDTTKSKMS